MSYLGAYLVQAFLGRTVDAAAVVAGVLDPSPFGRTFGDSPRLASVFGSLGQRLQWEPNLFHDHWRLQNPCATFFDWEEKLVDVAVGQTMTFFGLGGYHCFAGSASCPCLAVVVE